MSLSRLGRRVSRPSAEQTREHGWCLQLLGSQSFAFYLRELSKRQQIAHRDVCAEIPQGSRDYHAGRLAGISEAMDLVGRKYETLKPIVEVVPS